MTALAARVALWARTPQPVPVPIAPAPRTRAGVVARLAAEFFLFRALARASLPTWCASLALHYGLLLLLVVHLRFLAPQLPPWLVPFLGVGGWASLAALAGIAVLFVRRLAVDRLRYISVPSDYLHLVLLAAILVSGSLLKRVWPVELHAVGAWLRGVLGVAWQALPASAGLWAHLGLVALLIAVFPISKLLHAPGVAFAPTLHQRDRGGRSR